MARPAVAGGDMVNDNPARLALDCHKVFDAESPLFDHGKFHRYIYMERRTLDPLFLDGHKFEIVTKGEGDTITTDFVHRHCSDPVRSIRGSTKRLIGWVRREHFDRIQDICEQLTRPNHDCCHSWTMTAFAALRDAGVLVPTLSGQGGEFGL